MQAEQDWEKTVERLVKAYNTISRGVKPPKQHDLDLTSSQIKVLLRFDDKDSYTTTELSKINGVNVSTMTSMIDRLVQCNIVERHRDSDDRRVVSVQLGPHGKKVLADIMKTRRKALERFLRELTDEELGQFVASIENVAYFFAKAKKRLGRHDIKGL